MGRGENTSPFSWCLPTTPDEALKGIKVGMDKFRNGDEQLDNEPELFLEWAVEVKSTSTGYPKGLPW